MFRKAERRKAKLRCGLAGPSGSGKTYSALQIAFGLGGKIALIDTENGSGDLYAHLGDYDVLTLQAPFTPDKYIDGIKAAERAGYATVIIDSLSHAWAGEGGLLDQHGRIADSGKGNSYTAWRTITPKHNALVEAMLQSSCHVIATMRTKTEYIVEKSDRGKDVPRKVGLAPIQRDGMEYEFTVFFDLSADHTASSSKDRTSLFDGLYFRPTQETGVKLLRWLNEGGEAVAPPASGQFPAPQGTPESAPPGATGPPQGQDCARDAGQPTPPATTPAGAPPAEPVTDAQLKKIHAAFNDLGITDKNSRRSWIAVCLGRQAISSTKDISKAEASAVIDALEKAIAGGQKGAA